METPRTFKLKHFTIIENTSERDDWGLMVDGVLQVSSACMDSLMDVDTRDLTLHTLRAVDLDGQMVDMAEFLEPLLGQGEDE